MLVIMLGNMGGISHSLSSKANNLTRNTCANTYHNKQPYMLSVATKFSKLIE